MPRLAIRPLVFRTIILLVIVNATAGITVIVAGGGSQIGDTESNILLTTGMLSLAALLLLPCVLAHEAGRPRPFTLLPSFAVSCLLIGFSLGIYLLWTDPSGDTPEKIAWSFGIAGGGGSFVCLISLVRMRRGFVWPQLLAIVFSAVLTAMIVSAFWSDFADDSIDDWKTRVFIVAAILTAATSLLVPVVNLMLRSRPQGSGTPHRASFCPNCAAVLHMEEPRCLACGVRFRVEFLEA